MFYLKHNLPVWERATRLCLALSLGLAAHFYFPPGALLWVAWATAATLGTTAMAGFCPACAMAGRKPIGGKS